MLWPAQVFRHPAPGQDIRMSDAALLLIVRYLEPGGCVYARTCERTQPPDRGDLVSGRVDCAGYSFSILYKLVFHTRSSGQGTLLYVGMGWLGVIATPQIIHALPPGGITLLVGGGLAYSLGAIIYNLDDPLNRPRYFNLHDLWHRFVMAGSGLHFAAVLIYVAR